MRLRCVLRTRSIFVLLVFVAAVARAANLTPVGEPLGFSGARGRAGQVVASRNGYLLTWQSGSNNVLSAARLDVNGKPIDVGRVLSTDYLYGSWLASDGDDYLVVTLASGFASATIIDGETGAMTAALHTPAADVRSVLWDGSSYVVGIGATYQQLVLIRLDAHGNELSRSGPLDLPAVFFAPLLAGAGGDLAAFTIDAAGEHATFLARGGGAIVFPSRPLAIDPAVYPFQVATDGRQYLLVRQNGNDLVANFYDRNLNIERRNVVIGTRNDQLVKIVPRSQGFIVFIQPYLQKTVAAVLIDDQSIQTRILLTDAPYFQPAGTGAASANQFIWIYSDGGAGPKSLLFDYQVGATPRPWGEGTIAALEWMLPTAAVIGGDRSRGFLVAWQSSNATATRVAIRRFDASAMPLATEAILDTGNAPSVAADGEGGYLVGWLSGDNGAPAFARIAHVAADGSVSVAAPLERARGIQVVWARDHYVVAWQRDAAPHNTVAIRVARDGHQLDFNPVSVTDGDRTADGTTYTERAPLVATTSIGIFFAIPTVATQQFAQATYVDGLLFSYDLDRMRRRERITTAPAERPHLTTRGPLLLTYQDPTPRSVRISDDGQPLDSIGRIIEPRVIDVSTVEWIGDRWLIAAGESVHSIDASGVELNTVTVDKPGALALAAFAGGAMYVGQCPPDSAQLCMGTLPFGASHALRRVAH